MSGNIKLSKLQLTYDFLNLAHQFKQELLDELVIYATDTVRHHRRMRMLAQLSQYESQIIDKIANFQTTDPLDLDMDVLRDELWNVCHRSA